MPKSSFFTGQPLFNQLLKFIPRELIRKAALDCQSDYYCKRFTTYHHLVTLLYYVLNQCTSLREVTTGLLAWEQRLAHLGMNHFPRRSTISDANTNRDAAVFEKIYLKLLERYSPFLSDSRQTLSARVHIFDSTTITLFQEILKGAGVSNLNGKRKGGIKVHTLIRSDQDVPCMIRFSAAAANDSHFLKWVQMPAGSIIVFDRGYNDYRTLNRFHDEKITWVTRLRAGSVYEVLSSRPLSEHSQHAGVLSDQLIEMGHQHKKKAVKVKARLIQYKDPDSQKIFEFITNNNRFSPLSIARFYKQRWQIELLFKRLKQNYPLKYFIGDSENAIKLHIWTALIADLLLKVIKKGSNCHWSFSNLAAMFRLHLMTYLDLVDFVRSPEKALLEKLKNNRNNPMMMPSLFPT
jgi:hypothetical protein